MRTFLIILVILLFSGCFGGTIYYLYSKSQEKPLEYKTEQPAMQTIIKKTVATGSVVPRKEIEIKPQVSGLIEKLYVEAGDVVQKGDLIASIRIIPDMVNLNNAENRVNRARISLKNAQRDFERNKKLFEDGVIAEANYQQFELANNNALEEMTAAEDNLQLIRSGATKKSGKTGNTNVRAAIAGMILDVPVEEGNSVIEANTFNDGTTIVTVADMDEIIFEGKVDESEVGKIRTGMDLLLTIGAIEGERFDAKGLEENGAIQFEIRAALHLKKDQFIRAGYSANADIVLDRRDSVLAINESLLQFDEQDSTFVEIEVTPQEFEKKYIKTGLSDGINIEVISGISKETNIKNPNSGAPKEG
jgi:HlyD family secretion protein